MLWNKLPMPLVVLLVSIFLLFPFCLPSFSLRLLCGSAVKESTCNLGDLGLIPVLERFPEEGKIYPLQYSCLENSLNCTVHEVPRVGHYWVTFTFFLFMEKSSPMFLLTPSLPFLHYQYIQVLVILHCWGFRSCAKHFKYFSHCCSNVKSVTNILVGSKMETTAINIVIQAFLFPPLISLVFVHSSYSDRIPLIGCLINNINLFIIILKARKSKIRAHTHLVFSVGLISDLQVHFIVVTLHNGR